MLFGKKMWHDGLPGLIEYDLSRGCFEADGDGGGGYGDGGSGSWGEAGGSTQGDGGTSTGGTGGVDDFGADAWDDAPGGLGPEGDGPGGGTANMSGDGGVGGGFSFGDLGGDLGPEDGGPAIGDGPGGGFAFGDLGGGLAPKDGGPGITTNESGQDEDENAPFGRSPKGYAYTYPGQTDRDAAVDDWNIQMATGKSEGATFEAALAAARQGAAARGPGDGSFADMLTGRDSLSAFNEDIGGRGPGSQQEAFVKNVQAMMQDPNRTYTKDGMPVGTLAEEEGIDDELAQTIGNYTFADLGDRTAEANAALQGMIGELGGLVGVGNAQNTMIGRSPNNIDELVSMAVPEVMTSGLPGAQIGNAMAAISSMFGGPGAVVGQFEDDTGNTFNIHEDGSASPAYADAQDDGGGSGIAYGNEYSGGEAGPTRPRGPAPLTVPASTEPPSGLNLTGDLSQQLAQLSTLGIAGGDGGGIAMSPEGQEYWKNLVRRHYTGSTGDVRPVEQQYAKSILGLAPEPNVDAFLRAL